MAQIFRDIDIDVGLGLTPTVVLSQNVLVQNEDDGARFTIVFPSDYADYDKYIDIKCTSISGSEVALSYLLEYDLDMEKYVFPIPRIMTTTKKLYVQFRAVYPSDEQTVVDPQIIIFPLKAAIKTD